MEKMEYTKGKWRRTHINTIVNAQTGKQIATVVKGGRSMKELTANARLIASASAMDKILRLLALGEAKMEVNEFCFDGLRYSCKDRDWRGLINVIGREKINLALL